MLIAATSLPGIFLAPVIGILADRLGRRPVLTTCLTFFGMSGLAAAAAPSFELLVAARLGMGLGAAGLINLAIVLIGDHWDGAERTRLIGRNTVVLTVGLALVPPFGGLLTELVSWRAALALYGCALLTATAAWRALPAQRPVQTTTIREQLGGIGRIARRPQFLALFAGASLTFVLIFGIVLTTLPLHLEDQYGYGAGLRGLFLALPALPTMLVAFNVQRIRDALDSRWVMVIGALTMAVAFTLMGTTSIAALVVIGCLVYGLGEGALVPTIQDLVVSNAPVEYRGSVVALLVSGTRLGQTVGPIGAGALIGATSTFTTLLAGTAIAVALAAFLMVAPTGRKTADEPTPVALT